MIVVAGLLSTVFYVRFELHMHNLNLLALGLFSITVLRIAHSSSGLFYAASLSVKPSGAVLLLPRMLWAERYRWVLAATLWLAVFWIVAPAIWFCARLPGVYAGWLRSLADTALTPSKLSIQAGIAELMRSGISNPTIVWLTLILELGWNRPQQWNSNFSHPYLCATSRAKLSL